jgi:hypothetical protein
MYKIILNNNVRLLPTEIFFQFNLTALPTRTPCVSERLAYSNTAESAIKYKNNILQFTTMVT